jgi:cyclopropane fatty-acyl-phospholipid synthase-like methyltransferase
MLFEIEWYDRIIAFVDFEMIGNEAVVAYFKIL